MNFRTFSLFITPPLVGGPCVLNYTITRTSSDGRLLSDITVDVTSAGEIVILSEDNYDICSNTYSFTVEANTLTYTGDRSAVVTHDPSLLGEWERRILIMQ